MDIKGGKLKKKGMEVKSKTGWGEEEEEEEEKKGGLVSIYHSDS